MKFYDRIKAHPVLEAPPASPMMVEIEEKEPVDSTVAMLQVALVGEYQQWDLYTAYASRLQGESRHPIVEEFADHAKEEIEHIELIQRYLVSMGQNPTLQRKPLPDMPETASIRDIVQLQLKFEQDAVELYKKILNILPDNEPLKLDIEGILIKEQEHVHDLELILNDPSLVKIQANLMFRPTEHGQSTKPQGGYGSCQCGDKCGCGCKCRCGCEKSFLSKVNHQWCTMALKELTPDIYARWYQGKVLTAQEKAFVSKAMSLKWGIKDKRAILRFLDSH